MTKRNVLVAFACLATLLLATNGFGQACSSGVAAQFVGAGSSAQFNSFAYAANKTLGLPNFWTTGSAQLQDTRFSPPVVDTGVTAFVAWDNNAVCNLYVYFNIDSGVGVKDFFAYAKGTVIGGTAAREWGAVFGNPGSWTSAAGGNKVPGINDTGIPPAAIQTFLTTSPQPATTTQLPQPGCGQEGAVGATTLFCFITAGMTDVRPEDALFATTRALSAYSTTGTLAGMGYNQVACGAVGTNQGCGILDAFDTGKKFNVLNFKLSGTDPVSLATVPVYTTLSTGASPLAVLVRNADTSSLGLGNVTGGVYKFNNINRAVLASVFNGTLSCTGDILATPSGPGKALATILREPLSGTYNAWEFTAVRTVGGSAATAVKQNTASSTSWVSNDDNSQEFDPYGNLTTGPATNFGSGNCGAGAVNATTACGNPLYNPSTGTCAASAHGFKARAVGTGNVVKVATGGLTNPNLDTTNAIGYAFWSYQNMKPAASGCQTGVSGDVTCSTYLAHYLTVDGIDPFFVTPGGALDTVTPNPNGAFNFPQCGGVQSSSNSFPCLQLPFTHIYDGSYPLWSLLRFATFANVTGKQVTPAGSINMLAAAETEAADPTTLFSDFVPLLKNVSTAPYLQGIGGVTSSGTAVTWSSGNTFDSNWCGSTTFPATCNATNGKINIGGTNLTIATINSSTSITLTTSSTHATQVEYVWNAGTPPTGDLNLGVFRSHFKQSAINPDNGHSDCAGNYTGISIVGGTKTSSVCLIDKGGDEGGAVYTVQADTDFNSDHALFNVGGATKPIELYGQIQ